MTAIRLSEFANKSKVVKFDFEGSEVEAMYNPGILNKRFYDDLRTKGKEENSIYPMFMKIFVSWNIVDDNGQMLPITEDNLSQMPNKLINGLWLAMLEDASDFLPKTKSQLSVAA